MVEESPVPVVRVHSLGYPGTHHHILGGRLPASTTRDELLDDLAPRRFVVSAMFSKSLTTSNDIKCDPAAGSSFVMLTPAFRQPTVDTELGAMRLFANGRGEMSMATIELEAAGARDARYRFCAVLYPIIDYLSYTHNVPILVETIYMEDAEKGVKHMTYIVPYVNSKLKSATNTLRPEIKVAFSLYREAKISASAPYKVLSYYKVIEGLQDVARPRLQEEAKLKGIQLEEARDIVPHHEDYPPEAKKYVGKQIKAFRKHLLRKHYRDAVAHFGLEDKDTGETKPFDLSIPFEVWRMQDMVLPAELCARVVIESYLAVAAQLG